MKIKAGELPGELKRGLKPVYLISGDEPQQLTDCSDAIRHCAYAAMSCERKLFFIRHGFDWSQLKQAAANLSMFSSSTLYELRFETAPDKSACDKLQQLCSNIATEDIWLILCPRIKNGSPASRLMKSIEQQGIAVQVWPLSPPQTRQWLQNRLRREGLKTSSEAIEILLQRIEGNLVAAASEIGKLHLFANDDGSIDTDTVVEAIADNARFDGFNLAEQALAGNVHNCRKIIATLRREEVIPLQPLAALTRELNNLLCACRAAQSGLQIEQALKQRGVWPQRMKNLKLAAQRHASSTVLQMLRRAARVDQAVKSNTSGSAWQELELLTLQLAGIRVGI